jgi:hypothetical protein
VRAALARWLAVAALAFVPRVSAAHDQPFSHARLELDTATLEVQLHPVDAASMIGAASPDSVTGALGVVRHGRAVGAALAPRIALSDGGRPIPLTWQHTRWDVERRRVVVSYRAEWKRVPGRIRFEAHVVPDDPQHETFLDVHQKGRVIRQAVLTREHPDTDFYTTGAAGALAVIATFAAAGMHHIFIGPDHILFLIGLLLLGGRLSRLFTVVTGFTIGHSLTLALATLGIVTPPARIIEPLIALSIVWVGIGNLRTREGGGDWRILAALGFGLIHGFGFASVLREFGLPREALGWSLLSFNLGVEAGQACIVGVVAPLLALLRTTAPRAAPRWIAAASWCVIAAGGFWFFQRVFAAG